MYAILAITLLAQLGQVDIPYPVQYGGTTGIQSDDPTLIGLSWHKWQTKDFTILSINEQQGSFLAENIRDIKKWIFKRWGFPDLSFSAESRLFCVYDREMMKKLFNGLEESRVEIRKRQGRIEVCVGWLLLSDSPARTVPVPLTEICFAELSQRTGKNVSYCLIRGMAKLNLPIEIVKTELRELAQTIKANPSIYFSEALLGASREQYEKLKPEDKRLFDRESMVLCLLLRKEFGEDKFVHFISSGTDKSLFTSIYGFRDSRQFDVSFGRYMKDLLSDVITGRTPNSYLEITPKKK